MTFIKHTDDVNRRITDYTEEECLEEIKELRQALKDLRAAPAQSSLDGNFVSFAGKESQLQAQIREWTSRLRAIRADACGTHHMQGPSFEV